MADLRDRDANDLMGAFDFERDPIEPLILEERRCEDAA